MTTQIKVFGQIAKEIKAGDIFIPSFDSVEGHDVVTLTKTDSFKEVLAKYDEGAIGLDQLVKFIRQITTEELVQ